MNNLMPFKKSINTIKLHYVREGYWIGHILSIDVGVCKGSHLHLIVVGKGAKYYMRASRSINRLLMVLDGECIITSPHSKNNIEAGRGDIIFIPVAFPVTIHNASEDYLRLLVLSIPQEPISP